MDAYYQQQQQQQSAPGSMMGGDMPRGRIMFNKAHSVWMGDIESFMTDDFIRQQFVSLGLKVVNVRIMHSNKFQDQTLTYAFIELEDERTAIRTVQRYNEKPLPGDPSRKFKLNFTCPSQIKQAQDENSLFVGELSMDVDDVTLFSVFVQKYPSTKWAKVIKDVHGLSKGFGFVKFSHDEEYQKALYEMNGYTGLGTNPLRVSQATPKERRPNPNGSGSSWNSNPSNPMVQQHQQQMQYFNQATSGFQNPQEYYSYYYQQSGNYYNPQQQQHHQSQQQQYYDHQQMRQRQDKPDARPDADLEDHGEQADERMRERFVSSDLMGELEASKYFDSPLIVK